MFCDVIFSRLSGRIGSRARASLVFALIAFSVSARGFAQQTVPTRRDTPQPSKASPLLLEAGELLRQGSIEQAKEKIQEELQQNPSNVQAYNLLGIVETNKKDYAGALQAFQKALKIEPNSIGTLNNLGNLYVAQEQFDLAETEFRKALRLEPANRDGNYNLGLVLLARNLPTEAIVYFQRVHPLDNATRFNLIRAYFRAGRTAEGLKAAADLSSESKADVRLQFTLGVLLASQKQYRAAQLELEQADALQPETADILYNLGQVYFRTGDSAKAELILNRALKLKPDSPETLYQLAQVYQQQNRAVDALDALVRAHKLAPQNTDIIYLLARVSMNQNYFEDAIPLLESGLKIAPQRADLHAALGESYFKSDKTEMAIQEFQKLIDMDPTARSYALMGISYRRLGRFDKAKAYFEAGLKRDPRDASCLFNIGYIDERQGNQARAEELFQRALRANPDFSEALLELANLRIANKRFEEAAVLLRRYVKVSRDPASGYYKLATVEKSLHQTEASERDLKVFQTLSKDPASGPYPYQHIFDYVDERSSLSREARTQQDLTDLTVQLQKNPEQPQNLYLLAETYLKLGKSEEALKAVAQLDQLSAGDYRTQTGVGVLLARYRLYDDAISHFKAALSSNPDSDDLRYDLADAYFRKGAYAQALEVAKQVSAQGRQDGAFLSLLGDIQSHLGDTADASAIFSDAISRNPDNDQYYLSLALVELRENNVAGAEETLEKGLARIPSSGKILWGLGIVSVLEGKTLQAEQDFERAVNLLPEWSGSYSTLGVFYFQTGEIAKAREVLDRFKGSNAAGGLDINRIEEALSRAPDVPSTINEPMPMAARAQLLQLALSLADRTL
ncbi:MAG: tetratricopeptide repeat protein [Candidatus Acidiferrum sp.]|jgi:tetratricopeptide (TPR) repeat protein